MNIHLLSDKYAIRRLTPNDVDAIYELCRQNTLFYQYHPPFVTKQSILEDMIALPPFKTSADKYYLGFDDNGTLTAVMDLILNHPENGTAFIGFFMTNRQVQNKGIGSSIVESTARQLKAEGFGKIRLGVDKGNPQSYAFWIKNHFKVISEEKYLLMERKI